jgi:hypothetical protein
MRQFDLAGGIGALVLGLSLIGYALSELVLRPAAGFPTADMAVIVAGADTLRVGHWLKFGFAAGVALLAVGLRARTQADAPLASQLAALAGTVAVALFLASGALGLHILDVAERTFEANRAEAVATIFLRTVTVALYDAAGVAVGWYALLANLAAWRTRALPRALCAFGVAMGALFALGGALPADVALLVPLASIGWALLAGAVLVRRPRAEALEPPSVAVRVPPGAR